MRLKLFRAPDMAGAMASVRADLGAEALILATRRTRAGVEITAALDPDDPAPLRPLAPAAVAPSAIPPETPRLAALRFHGVPEPLRATLLGNDLSAALVEGWRFAPLALAGDAPPLLLIGPPGAGKTLTIARLATRLVMAGENPLVITTDGRRAGAVEQLCAFTRLLGINLVAASHPVSLARALATRPAGCPVLIDTAGIDPFDPVQREEMSHLLAVSSGVAALVLPAGLDVAEAADFATACATIGARYLVGTRFDLARRLGGILAAGAAGLALSEAGTGPGAADGLTPLTPSFLAAQLLRVPSVQSETRT